MVLLSKRLTATMIVVALALLQSFFVPIKAIERRPEARTPSIKNRNLRYHHAYEHHHADDE